MFSAKLGDSVAGMLLWFIQGEVAYYHLGAYSREGYEKGASYALFPAAIEHFASIGLRWLDLGAGAGTSTDGTDGLTRFKRGWSTETRTAFLCGRVFDASAYERITKMKGVAETGYFPAYRKGEFI